jgi:hypothetical protein
MSFSKVTLLQGVSYGILMSLMRATCLAPLILLEFLILLRTVEAVPSGRAVSSARISCAARYTRIMGSNPARGIYRVAVRSENCKWYSSLPLGAVVSLFCESV